jgi:hypothetical protein
MNGGPPDVNAYGKSIIGSIVGSYFVPVLDDFAGAAQASA